jgi:hypothetical protein
MISDTDSILRIAKALRIGIAAKKHRVDASSAVHSEYSIYIMDNVVITIDYSTSYKSTGRALTYAGRNASYEHALVPCYRLYMANNINITAYKDRGDELYAELLLLYDACENAPASYDGDTLIAILEQ